MPFVNPSGSLRNTLGPPERGHRGLERLVILFGWQSAKIAPRALRVTELGYPTSAEQMQAVTDEQQLAG